jgi:hypothetical protein
VEFDVGEDGEGHEEDESRVEEDKAGLGDVPVVLGSTTFLATRGRRSLPKRMRAAVKAEMATGYPDSRMMA